MGRDRAPRLCVFGKPSKWLPDSHLPQAVGRSGVRHGTPLRYSLLCSSSKHCSIAVVSVKNSQVGRALPAVFYKQSRDGCGPVLLRDIERRLTVAGDQIRCRAVVEQKPRDVLAAEPGGGKERRGARIRQASIRLSTDPGSSPTRAST